MAVFYWKFLNRVSEEFKKSTEAKIIQEQEQIAEIYHSKSMLDDEMIYEGVGWQPDKRFTRFLYKKNSCSWDIDDLDQFTDPYLSIKLNTTSQRILEEEIEPEDHLTLSMILSYMIFYYHYLESCPKSLIIFGTII